MPKTLTGFPTTESSVSEGRTSSLSSSVMSYKCKETKIIKAFYFHYHRIWSTFQTGCGLLCVENGEICIGVEPFIIWGYGGQKQLMGEITCVSSH